MKIRKITHKGIMPVETTIHKTFHNLRHGTKGRGLWTYSISVSSKLLNTVISPDPVTLEKDNYVLLPITHNKEHKKDGRGNYMYFLSESERDYDKNDYLILWEIPNKMFTDVTFTIGHNAEVIGEGINGGGRHGVDYFSPAPVVEVTGRTYLKWSGMDKDKNYVSQKIEFDGNEWVVGKIKQEEI